MGHSQPIEVTVGGVEILNLKYQSKRGQNVGKTWAKEVKEQVVNQLFLGVKLFLS